MNTTALSMGLSDPGRVVKPSFPKKVTCLLLRRSLSNGWSRSQDSGRRRVAGPGLQEPGFQEPVGARTSAAAS